MAVPLTPAPSSSQWSLLPQSVCLLHCCCRRCAVVDAVVMWLSSLRGVPLLGLNAARALRSAHPHCSRILPFRIKGGAKGVVHIPLPLTRAPCPVSRLPGYVRPFCVLPVLCMWQIGKGGTRKLGRGCARARTHPFAHPVRTPHLRPCAQTGRMCAHPPLSARGQQSMRKKGGGGGPRARGGRKGRGRKKHKKHGE